MRMVTAGLERRARFAQRSAVSFVCVLLSTAMLWAQDATPSPQSAQEYDLTDLIRDWRHKPPPESDPGKKMIVAAPIIGPNPSAGFLIGAAAQMAIFRGTRRRRASPPASRACRSPPRSRCSSTCGSTRSATATAGSSKATIAFRAHRRTSTASAVPHHRCRR